MMIAPVDSLLAEPVTDGIGRSSSHNIKLQPLPQHLRVIHKEGLKSMLSKLLWPTMLFQTKQPPHTCIIVVQNAEHRPNYYVV